MAPWSPGAATQCDPNSKRPSHAEWSAFGRTFSRETWDGSAVAPGDSEKAPSTVQELPVTPRGTLFPSILSEVEVLNTA